eukprot:356151-Rhodomonas_salina.4
MRAWVGAACRGAVCGAAAADGVAGAGASDIGAGGDAACVPRALAARQDLLERGRTSACKHLQQSE